MLESPIAIIIAQSLTRGRLYELTFKARLGRG